MPFRKPKLLLINPWIYDFAAYDLWVQPLGLLLMATKVREVGAEVFFLDCLDSGHPGIKDFLPGPRRKFQPARYRAWGQGKFFSEIIEKPSLLSEIPRHYRRYGIPPELFRKDLLRVGEPDAVLVTSGMTYWYPGVQAAIEMIKELYPRTPVILGGVYATLLPDHARKFSGADYVLPGRAEEELAQLLGRLLGMEFAWESGDEQVWWSYPALGLKREVKAVPILTSRGCPFRCGYCASRILFPGFFRREATGVISEIRFWNRSLGLQDFVFFDDALLSSGANYVIEILKGILDSGAHVRFHSPNGINIRGLTPELARWMKQADWKTLRLSLESADPGFRERMGKKMDNREFEQAVRNLHAAGFAPEEIGVYILAGLPGQGAEEVEESIRYVRERGARPIIAEYSPIPGTEIWSEAIRASPFDLSGEPLFQNNTILPCRWEGFSYEDLGRLKQLTQRS